MAERQYSTADFVRERRRASQMTQHALASLAGVRQDKISEIERGKPSLRMDTVNRVLAVFGCRLGPVPAERHEDEP